MVTEKKGPSWIAIIIWFIIFWPVSIYLLWKKITKDKAAAMGSSKVLMVLGVLFIVAALGVCTESVGLTLFYGIGGAGMIWASGRVKRSGVRYKQYIEFVVNQRRRNIDDVAAAMNISYDDAVKGLNKMISLGYFKDAYIDHGTHEIVFPQLQQAEAALNDEKQTVQMRTIKCPNCGGNNTAPVGKVCECMFCGSPIE